MRLLITVTAILLGLGAAAAGPVLPAFATNDDLTAYFGSDRNVDLVAALLPDKDYTIRAQVIADLGEMQNYKGLEFIRKAAKDDSPQVRSAAALAAARFDADRAGDIVATCLQDKDATVAMNALRAVRMMPLPAVRDLVTALTSHKQSAVQADAIATLTALKLPMDAKTLSSLLDSPSPVVRLRALEHTMLLDAGNAPKDKLSALARTGPAAVRCAALAALGKFDYAGGAQTIAAAAKDPDPQIRLGAVLAIEHAAKADQIKPFLDDRSEMVRLAAIRAAGATRARDCVATLMKIMLDAPLDELAAVDTQKAARDSIIAIGTPEAAQLAAAEFSRIAPKYQVTADAAAAPASAPANIEQTLAADALRKKWARDISACCRILGAQKSKLVLDEQIAYLAKQPTDSLVLADLIWSLGEIGDQKALATLEPYTDKCTQMAQQSLAARLAMPPPYVPYNAEGTAQCLAALDKLKSPNLLDKAKKLGLMQVQHMRLDRPVEEAVKVFAHLLAAGKDRAAVEAALVEIVADPMQSRLPRCESMKLLGQYKAASAVKAIQEVLTTERPGRRVMQVAAWSLYQIDGKDHPVGDPVVATARWIVMEQEK